MKLQQQTKPNTVAFVPNHQHLLIKGHIMNPPTKEEDLNSWLKSLVQKVGMAVVAGPTSVYVNEPGNEGITGTVTLATSHAAIHVWDAVTPAMFQFDIYSCKEFDVEVVLDHINAYELQSCQWMKIDRNDEEMKITSVGAR